MTLVLVLCDVDVHVPSNGEVMNEDIAGRSSKYASLLIGSHPRISAPTVALTSGTIVIAIDAK